jgi:hypothetical protein
MTSKIQSTVDDPKPQPDEANPESKAVSHEDTKKDNKQFMFFSFLCGLCGFV